MAKKRRKGGTISPSHQAKMQEGRRIAKTRRKQEKLLKDADLPTSDSLSYTERLLKDVRRK